MRNVQDPALMNIINTFQNFHKSIISDLFYGFKKQILTCNICKNKLTNYQIFNLIIFPVEAIYNSSKNKNIYQNKKDERHINYRTTSSSYGSFYNGYTVSYQSHGNYGNDYNYGYGSKKVSLYDCFEYEIKDLEFKGDNQ